MQEVFGQGFHVSFEWIDLQHLDENIGPTLQQAVQSSSPLKGPMDSHARIEEQAFVQAENLLKILDAKVLSAHHREQILQHKSKGSSIFVLFHKKSNDLRWGEASQKSSLGAPHVAPHPPGFRLGATLPGASLASTTPNTPGCHLPVGRCVRNLAWEATHPPPSKG